MASDEITIRATLLDETAAGAASAKEHVKSIGETAKASGTTVDAVGTKLDKVTDTHTKMTEATKASTKAMKDLTEQGNKLREGFGSIGETITDKLRYPLQQMTYSLEAAGVGMVAFGLLTESSFQKASLSLNALYGATQGLAISKALYGLSGPVDLGTLVAGQNTLTNAGGLSNPAALALQKGLTNISAVSPQGAAGYPALAAAAASLAIPGPKTLANIQPFLDAGLPIYQMLAKDNGGTPADLRRILNLGGPFNVPSNLLSQIAGADPTGRANYQKTLPGTLDELKKAAGAALAGFESPLTSLLSGEGPKLSRWLDDTTGRFTLLKGALGTDLGSDNFSKFGTDLGRVFGDPSLAGAITGVATTVHGFSLVLKNDVIPMGRDLLSVAVPALQGFGNVVTFLGDHRSTFEAITLAVGGFVVFGKVAGGIQAAAEGLTAFSTVLESRGLLSAMAAYGRGTLGLTAKAVAGEEATGAVGAEGAGLLGASGAGAFGTAFGLAVAPALELALFGYWTANSKPGQIVGAAPGQQKDFQHRLSSGQSLNLAFGGSIQDAINKKYANVMGPYQRTNSQTSATTVHVHSGAIQINGAGNPEAVANFIPGSLGDLIDKHNARTAQRGG